MAIAYYGSVISTNMTETPEGYLICRNVPVGRTGAMDYLAEELGLEDKRGQVIKVTRSAEELFSKATMASFEGKPVTNEHPSKNLDINTIGFAIKGHMTNVRRAENFLVADLFITDQGLINDIRNGKREVSCGYDCLWVPNEEGSAYEQKNIIGNHVAVVHAGRAGSRVAIKDSGENLVNRRNKKMAKKMSKSFLAALGFKHFAQDADPEDVAEAMDALKEDDPEEDDKKGAQDSDSNKEVMDAIGALGDTVKSVMDRVAGLESSIASGTVKKQVLDASSVFDSLEKEAMDEEVDEEAKDAETVEEEAKDEETVAPAADSLTKFVQDMKPIIMSIPDETLRLKAAQAFAKSVKDARAAGAGVNGYGAIVGAVTKNKMQAMDQQTHRGMSQSEAAIKAAEAWNKVNAQKGGI